MKGLKVLRTVIAKASAALFYTYVIFASTDARSGTAERIRRIGSRIIEAKCPLV
jgi:hypothetical protein